MDKKNYKKSSKKDPLRNAISLKNLNKLKSKNPDFELQNFGDRKYLVMDDPESNSKHSSDDVSSTGTAHDHEHGDEKNDDFVSVLNEDIDLEDEMLDNQSPLPIMKSRSKSMMITKDEKDRAPSVEQPREIDERALFDESHEDDEDDRDDTISPLPEMRGAKDRSKSVLAPGRCQSADQAYANRITRPASFLSIPNHDDLGNGGVGNPGFNLSAAETSAEEEFLRMDRRQTILHSVDDEYVPTMRRVGSGTRSTGPPQRSRAESVMVPLEVHRRVYNQRAFDREFQWEKRDELLEFKNSMRSAFCMSKSAFLKRILSLFPIITWIPKYSIRTQLLNDAVAGLTVGVMQIPQGMAYATLANVPPVNGLYASMVPGLVYMIFGTSAQVSFGTFAVMSLMVGQVVASHPLMIGLKESLATGTFVSDNSTGLSDGEIIDGMSVSISQTLTLFVGIILVIMGVCRVGFIAAYLSDQVVSGFSTGAGCYVATSQLGSVFGLSLTKHSGPLSLLWIYIEFFQKLGNINWWAVLVAAVTLAVLIAGKEFISPAISKYMKIPIPWDLIVVVFGTLICYLVNMEKECKLSVVGEIPLGLQIGIPSLAPEMVQPIIVDAITISFVVFVLTVSVGKLYAKKFHYAIDVAQEPYAYGLANIGTSLFFGIVSCASLTRSQMLADLGSSTTLHNIFSSGLILLVLFVLASLFYSLPKAVLAAIIIMALKGIFKQFQQLKRLWIVSKTDFVVNIPSVKIFRYDSALMFTNSERFRLTLLERCGIDLNQARQAIAVVDKEVPEEKKVDDTVSKNGSIRKRKEYANVKVANHGIPKERDFRLMQIRRDLSLPDVIVLDCSGFNYIDFMGVNVLLEVYNELTELGILLLYAVLKAPVRDMLEISDFYSKVSKVNLFPTVHDAVTYGLFKVEQDRLFHQAHQNAMNNSNIANANKQV